MTETLQTHWPSEPYKGLAHYGPDDRPLFTGRDEDVDVCIHFLAAPETRILLLHGQTGCGKSSFLRAGLIPSLEERAFGYLFLRDTAGAPVFIRCGPDPIGRIAEHLFSFASQPVKIDTARGERVYDVTEACLGCKDVKDYIEACRKPGLLTSSLLTLAKLLPYTLVIILDQAEEVITLAEGKSDYRRQFFRFVREFSTTNFPLKFVLALRKDNSGEFIGLAQMGGSLELPPLPSDTGTFQAAPGAENGGPVARDTISAGIEARARPVKSDIKIFLLSELTRDEVLHAILQPTLRTPVDGRTPPFDTYQFDYAEGVARKIVDDIFDATSSTAVLPVMQIVCRDLYNRATTDDPASAGAAPTKRPRPWRIDLKLYETGGGIQGPVDRHVSRSLVGSFASMVPDGELKAEERRWRDILFRLVRRESDGTVHTNIVSLAQLRAIADEVQPIAKVDQVVEYLTRPDVLLLRRVTILSADDSDEARWYSLGHDFIGMVLQHWKLRQEENEAAHRRVVRFAKTAGWATLATVAVVGSVIYVGYRASEHGKAESKHQVLVNSAKFKQREDPMFALLAAAQASRVADELSKDRLWLGNKPRDSEADALLANMLAGLPKTTEFSTGPASPADNAEFSGADRNMPLPKAKGYVVFDDAKAQIVIPGRPSAEQFDLDPMPIEFRTAAIEPSVVIDEPKAGSVLLMRTVNRSQFEDLAFSAHQLFVFTPNGKLGPFDADYFRHFVDSDPSQPSAAPPDKPARKQPMAANAFEDPARFAREGLTWIALSGGVVVLYKLKPPAAAGGNGSLTIDSFVFDERKSPKPFRRGFVSQQSMDKSAVLEYEPNPAYGLFTPLRVDGYLVVPEPRVGGKEKHVESQARIVRYDLRRPKRSDGQHVELTQLMQKLTCAPQTSCQWQLIPRREPGSLILFGALRSSAQVGQRSLEQLNQADLDNFERFVIADVSNDRAIAVESADLRKALDGCATRRADAATAGSATPKASTRLFISGSVESLVIGFPTAHAIDLVRIDESRGPQCTGTLMAPPDLNRWSFSADASTLLAAGPRAGAVWDVKQSVQDRAKQLLTPSAKDAHEVPMRLVRLACEAGLKNYRPSRDLWMATTFLDQAPPVCEGAVSAATGTSSSTPSNAP